MTILLCGINIGHNLTIIVAAVIVIVIISIPITTTPDVGLIFARMFLLTRKRNLRNRGVVRTPVAKMPANETSTSETKLVIDPNAGAENRTHTRG